MQLASVLAPLAVENYKGQIFCWKKQEHRYLLFLVLPKQTLFSSQPADPDNAISPRSAPNWRRRHAAVESL
jgi:hypothetical protein